MTRAKLPRLKRRAAVVLGNVRTTGEVDVLTQPLEDNEPARARARGVGARATPCPVALLHGRVPLH